MAYGAFASGLLGAISGAGEIARDERQRQEKEFSAQRLMMMELEMKDQFDQRKVEQTKQRNIADYKKIDEIATINLANKSMAGMGEAGTGVNLRPEDIQTLRDNPEAVAAYRAAGAKGLLNASRQEEAETKSSAALSVGNTTFADKYEAQAKGERDDTRIANKEKKDEQYNNQHLKLLEKQIDQASANALSQSRRDDNAENKARMAALGDAAKSGLERMKEIDIQLKQSAAALDDKDKLSPARVEVLRAESESLGQQIKSINSRQIYYGQTGKPDMPEPAKNSPEAIKALQDALKSGAAKPAPAAPAPVMLGQPPAASTQTTVAEKPWNERIADANRLHEENSAADKARAAEQKAAKERDAYNTETEGLKKEITLANLARTRGAPNQERIERLKKLIAERG